MRKTVFIFAMLMTTLTVRAQYEEGDILIQPRVGITISNITDGDKSKINVTYGVEFERFFTDQLSFAAGVLFTDQGCKYEIYYDTDGSQYNDTKMNLYYGALPITANYYILPGLALKAGIQPAFRVKANIQHGDEKLDFDKMLSSLFPGEEVKMNKFDLSIPVGLSYEYNRVTIDARYNIGVTNLLSGSTDAVHNKVFAITLGYKFGR
jgi:hypothetical protein